MRPIFKYHLFNKRNKRKDVKLRPIKINGFIIHPVIIPRRSNKEKRECKYDAYATITNNLARAIIARQFNGNIDLYARSVDYSLKEAIYTMKESIHSRMTPFFLSFIKLCLDIKTTKEITNSSYTTLDDSCFAVDNLNEELFKSLDVDRGMTSPVIYMTEKDTEFLLDTLENPPPPSEFLISAMKEYKAQLSEGKLIVKEVFQDEDTGKKH